MWLAHKVTTYSNATILKIKWFHTIISGHFLELCATQAAQRVTNHTLYNSALFPVVPGIFVCLLGPCAQNIIYIFGCSGICWFSVPSPVLKSAANFQKQVPHRG